MTCGDMHYLEREAEHLVLEGYRRWCIGLITGDHRSIADLRQVYQDILGHREAMLAYSAMIGFTQALGRCATCPLRTSRIGCRSICRDEAMILGLISGIQHDEQTTIALCLDVLVGPDKQAVALSAAEALACILSVIGRKLLPVPSHTVRAVLSGERFSAALH